MGLYGSLALFSPTCHAFKTLFELSRVKLYRIFLKGNKNVFELAGGSQGRSVFYALLFLKDFLL